ncbi:MAG: RdgB/HAM1 family non-canonical purine NTP pyrophosphatase [Bacteroidales bacterium]
MMKKLLLATNNLHKLSEIRQITNGKFEILSLNEVGFTGDIPETSPTIEGNAIQKVQFIFDRIKMDCFADDTGLEVEALNGEPGVYSARYAGEQCSFSDNIVKLLAALDGETNRKARFRTVIALIFNNELFTFEGIIDGRIGFSTEGNSGFGYDPVFIPDGYEVSFASMDSDLKNTISHRGRATALLMDFLNSKQS